MKDEPLIDRKHELLDKLFSFLNVLFDLNLIGSPTEEKYRLCDEMVDNFLHKETKNG